MRGIPIEPTKAKVVMNMPPVNLNELITLQDIIQAIRRFITYLDKRCEPFYQLLGKGARFDQDRSPKII